MDRARPEGRAVRGDRADGQGVRQPACGSSCSTCWRRRRAPSTSSRARAASRRRTPPSTCRRCTPRAWSRARARAPRALRAGRRRGAVGCGWRCATPRSRGWPRSSAPPATTSARTSTRSDATSCSQRLGRGDVVLVDVRPEAEYAAGHIEGARSIPLDELERRLAELPADREVVAYCRGPFCAYAHEAVRRLQRRAGRSGAGRGWRGGGWPRDAQDVAMEARMSARHPGRRRRPARGDPQDLHRRLDRSGPGVHLPHRPRVGRGARLPRAGALARPRRDRRELRRRRQPLAARARRARRGRARPRLRRRHRPAHRRADDRAGRAGRSAST